MASSQVLSILKEGELKNSGIISHVSELIRSQLQPNNQLKSLKNIQLLSYFLRTHSFEFKKLLNDNDLHKKVSSNKCYGEYLESLKKLADKLQKIQNTKAYTMPDILTQHQAFKTAGISVGETNCYHLNNVLRQLAIQNDAKQIRFWGKILGKKDYYVIQGLTSKSYAHELGPDSQGYGTGVNDYSYWVSNTVLGDWVQLPLVTPSQLVASREFKSVFSGNLEAEFSPLCPFNGKQKHLLKCVITRITHSCQLVPKDIYKANQQNATIIEFNEDFKVPEVAQMGAPQSWFHQPANILNQGRISHYIDSSVEGQQRQAKVAELTEKDPVIDRLKPISEDKPFEFQGHTAASNWIIQQCGETIPINLIGKQEGQTAIYGVVLVKNLSWPGASTIAYRGGWSNIYIGYGNRVNQQNKIIKQLGDIQVQGVDTNQISQPNPSEAPVEKKENAEENAEENQPDQGDP